MPKRALLIDRGYCMRRLVIALSVVGAMMGGANAQSQGGTDFVTTFAGQWQTFDPVAADGSGICTITLDQLSIAGALSARAGDCSADLAGTSQWEIVENQIVLSGGDGRELARFGGNPRRLTGETVSGLPLVLEARGGDGAAQQIQSALNAAGCLYLGYTTKCASPRDEDRPPLSEGAGRVQVLVDLNARTTPRSDARVLGVVKQDTCLIVNQCTMASDGVWCRADFNGGTGWVSKLAIRQQKWPVVTYLNDC